jgi:hypothetical protein
MAKKKNAAAVELGRLGGKKKVPKGLSMLTPEQRIARAREGALARWEIARKAGRTKKPATS